MSFWKKLLRLAKVTICTLILMFGYLIYSLMLHESPLKCGKYSNWIQPVLTLKSPRDMFSTDHLDTYRDVCLRLGYKIEVNPSAFKLIGPDTDIATHIMYRVMTHRIFHEGANRKIVDNIPGLHNFVTHKANLVKRGGKYIPKGFHLPFQTKELFNYLQVHKNKTNLWIEKDAETQDHTVKGLDDLDLNRESLVQEYISNPFLIDNRKFSIGIYVAFTSANPLRAYILDSAILVRFARTGYYPFNISDLSAHITDGIDFHVKLIGEVEPLKTYYWKNKYSTKAALDAYVSSKGKDPSVIYTQIYDAVRDVLQRRVGQIGQKVDPTTKYFEFTRWDFLLDDNLNIHLIEVNFNPGLRCGTFVGRPADPAVCHYRLYNAFRVMGLEDLHEFQYKRAPYIVRDSDVQVEDNICYTPPCMLCNLKNCRLCSQCLSRRQKDILKAVLWEHLKRGPTRLVYPSVLQNEDKDFIHSHQDEQMVHNTLTVEWLHAKCIRNVNWCNLY